MITSFSHIYYRVRDVEESITFFTELLGFTLLRKYSNAGRVSGYLNLGNVLLEVTPAPPDMKLEGERRIGLTVDDMDATLAALTAAGVEVAAPPFDARTFWGRQCVIKDPSGCWISLREWKSPDSPTFPDWQPKHEGMTRLA